MADDDDPCITIDVGGTRFRTLRSHLTSGDTFFSALLGGGWADSDSEDIAVFRDPRHFRTVLTYLQTGNAWLPTNGIELEELREEAAFYGVTGLMEAVDQRLERWMDYVMGRRERDEELQAKALEEELGQTPVRVAVRARPLIESEAGSEAVLNMTEDGDVGVKGEMDTHRFHYLATYNEDANHELVYNAEMSPLVRSALNGYNGTFFCYGQSGSGKTHTMLGDVEDPGIIPRALDELFQRCAELRSDTVTVSVGMTALEVYRGKCHDLLMYKKPQVPLHCDGKKGFWAFNATMTPVTTRETAMTLLDGAMRQREQGATDLNAVSSRSHLIITLHTTVTKHTPDGLMPMASKLHMVDLAGSERQTKSGCDGVALKEGVSINLSLSALGIVVDAIVKQRRMIPYRSSPLTMLLKDSLGGAARTRMVATVSPSALHTPETISTLRFAARMMMVQNKVRQNVDPRDKMIMELKEEVDYLRQLILTREDSKGARVPAVAHDDPRIVTANAEIDRLRGELLTATAPRAIEQQLRHDVERVQAHKDGLIAALRAEERRRRSVIGEVTSLIDGVFGDDSWRGKQSEVDVELLREVRSKVIHVTAEGYRTRAAEETAFRENNAELIVCRAEKEAVQKLLHELQEEHANLVRRHEAAESGVVHRTPSHEVSMTLVREERQRLEAQVSDLTAQVKDNASQRRVLKESVASRGEEVRRLRQQLQEAEKAREGAQIQADQKAEQLGTWNDKVSSLAAALEERDKASRLLESQVKETAAAWAAKFEGVQQVHVRMVAERDQAATRWTDRVTVLENELRTERDGRRQEAAASAKWSAQVQQLSQELASRNACVKKSQGQFEQAERAQFGLASELNSRISALQQKSAAQVESLEAELRDKKEELAECERRAKRQIDRLTAQVQQLRQSVVSREATAEVLRSQNLKTGDAAEEHRLLTVRLTDTVSSLEDALAQREADIKAVEARCDDLQSEAVEASNEIQRLKAVEATVDLLALQGVEANNEIQRLKNRLRTAKRKAKEEQEKNAAEKAALSVQLAQANHEGDDLRERLDDMQRTWEEAKVKLMLENPRTPPAPPRPSRRSMEFRTGVWAETSLPDREV